MIAPPAAPSARSDTDSDSDWDDDDDFAKKINIRIKPIAQVTPSKFSASVDELRASVGTWKSLANINLVKPNSRRHHQSTVQLQDVGAAPPTENNGPLYSGIIEPDTLLDSQAPLNGFLRSNTSPSTILSPGLQSAFQRVTINDDRDTIKLPVALAVQECLNARFVESSNDTKDMIALIGRIKMATPLNIYDINSSQFDPPLEVTLVASLPWDRVELNTDFVTEQLDNEQFQMNPSLSSSNSTKRLLIDMKAIQSYVRNKYQKQPDTKYFVLPELLRYTIRSQDAHELAANGAAPPSQLLSPLKASAHWLFDLDVTKVRVDLKILETTINGLGLTTDHLTSLKISLHVNGGVTSYQSKPDASWNPLDSKLTWSFSNLTELIQQSTLNGNTSCLARFNLNDGPSTPDEVSLQFSIVGKTISGAHIVLDSTNNYRLATQKYEVRTGTFKCVPPRL